MQETDIYGNIIDWSEGFGYEDEAGLEDESNTSIEESTTESNQLRIQENTSRENTSINQTKNAYQYRFGLGEVFMLILIAVLIAYLFISKRSSR